MSPGRFCVGMTLVVMALTCVTVMAELDYLAEFWIVLRADHAVRLSVMASAWLMTVIAGTYQLARCSFSGRWVSASAFSSAR